YWKNPVSSPFPFSRRPLPRRSLLSSIDPPSDLRERPMHPVPQPACPVELVPQQRDAQEHQQQARPRNERQAQDGADDQQEDAQHEAPETDGVLHHALRRRVPPKRRGLYARLAKTVNE